MTAARVTWRGQMAAQRIPLALEAVRKDVADYEAKGDERGAEVMRAVADVLEREAARAEERAR